MKQALIIMAKQPEAGRTKTRLCPPLTLEQSAELYECFLTDIVDIVRTLQASLPNLQPFFAYTPEESRDYFAHFTPGFSVVPQIGDTLGERLDYVLSTCLAQGYDQVAAINSDSPNLPAELLRQAFQALDRSTIEQESDGKYTDIVFGPSEDGGYYLIGVTKPWSRVVCDVTMSTPTVLQDSLTIAKEEGAAVKLLPAWYDIDTVDELKRLYAECKDSHPSTGAGLAAKNTVAYIESQLEGLG